MKTLDNRQIGLGTFPFSGVFSTLSQTDAEEIVKTFVDLGGRYIETAPIYPRDNVDMRALLKKFSRDDYLIGTKCVLYLDGEGVTQSSGTPESLREQCLGELRRLGVDYLDLVEAHVTATDVSSDVVASALNELKKEGLVRYVGASNASSADVLSYVKGGGIDYIQNRYSIIHREATEGITDICVKHGIKFNPYQVIERGQLIDASERAGVWREGDLRAQKSEYVGDVYNRVHTWAVGELGKIAADADLTLEQLSIRWVFSKPMVFMPVIGATKRWQIEANMAAGTEPLPSDVLDAVDSAYNDFATSIRERFGLSVEEFRGLV